MAFLTIRTNVLGEQQYQRSFLAFERELEDLSEPLAGVRDILREAVAQQFDSEGAHGGTPWVQLNPDYEKWKAERYPGQKILQRTGALHDQLIDHGTIELGPRRLVWGVHPGVTNQDGARVDLYGARHQTGDSDGHPLPQRKIIALREDERRLIDREFVSWLNGLRHKIIGAPR